MDNRQLLIVEGCHVEDSGLDLRTADAWSFALDQRYFGPRQLVVVTAAADGQVIGLAHCRATEAPELALECCVATLDDGAAAAVAYSDEPVGSIPPPGLAERFAAARAMAHECGVHLVDWMMCDDTEFRSMRFTLEDVQDWWDLPRTGSGCR